MSTTILDLTGFPPSHVGTYLLNFPVNTQFNWRGHVCYITDVFPNTGMITWRCDDELFTCSVFETGITTRRFAP